MIETLQIEEVIQAADSHSVPKLQVEWSSRWREFVESIKPAMARSERRLAGEAPFGLIPLRIMIPSYVLEALLILIAVVGYAKIQEMRPYVAPRFSSHDVIYYSGDELPRTEDLGGAETGTSGRAGGSESHHRTQTIKMARAGQLVPRVVDANKLRLPISGDEVANLLAIQPNAGPPPSEGLRSTRATPNLPSTVVAPSPSVAHDYTRNGIALNEVIAPAPTVERDRPLTAPNLSASVIPPAPSVQNNHTLVAPRLDPVLIAPARNVSRDQSRSAPSLANGVVAPAPELAHDRSRSTPTLAANVIPPAPGSVTRQLSSAPLQMTNVAVVPLPVSAPERTSSRNAKLSLPAPAVIAPPPSTDVSQDLHRLSNGSVPDPSKAVVPPPPTPSGSGSFMSSILGKIFGPSEVVPPPTALSSSATRSGAGTTLTLNVVAPPPSVATSSGPTGNRNGAATSLASNVVAPPSTGISGNGRTASSAPRLGPPTVVPPPPSLSGAGGGTGTTGGGAGTPRGTLQANNVIPPPPPSAVAQRRTEAASGAEVRA